MTILEVIDVIVGWYCKLLLVSNKLTLTLSFVLILL